MKFRAVMKELRAMRDFMNIASTISKFSKYCVLRITPKKLYFIVSEEDSGPRRPFVWCELPVNSYFQEYELIGVTDEFNEIFLEFSTALLARALAMLKQNVLLFKLKLTNKQQPCLTIDMQLESGDFSNRQIVHDIPVEVISRRHWPDYEEPICDDFHITIELPSLKALKSITERMRNIGHGLTVSADKHGKLTLEIDTQVVKLAAHFSNLDIQSFTGVLPVEDGSDKVSSTVDIKRFQMFLAGLQISNTKTTCSIIHNKLVKFYMEQPDVVSIQVFLSEVTI